MMDQKQQIRSLVSNVIDKNYAAAKDNLKAENLKESKSLCILIGPEGDFTPSERESILGIPAVRAFKISKNILRSDTAVISAISLVNFINNFH